MDRPWLRNYPKGISPTIDADRYSSIAAMLDDAVNRFPDREAMRCIDIPVSYRNFKQEAEAFAAFLQQEWNMKPGDRLAIMLPNLIDFPVVFYAATMLGVICVPTNPLYTPREMEHQFKDSGAKAIVIFEHFLCNLEKVLAKTDIKHIATAGIGDRLPLWKKLLVRTIVKATGLNPSHGLKPQRVLEQVRTYHGRSPSRSAIASNDIAILQYTGGTTGVSKGAMLTHRNVVANAVQNAEWAKDHITDAPQTVLGALPLYHIYALTVNFISFLASGNRVILLPRPIPIKKTVAAFKKYEIHMMTGVNTIFNEMVRDPEFRALKPRNLKCALAGGMALQKAVADEWEAITNVPAIEGYGLTEASPVTHCNPLNDDYRLGSIGLPIPSTEAMIVKEDGSRAAPGESGELLVRGPQIMLGYWNRPEETAKVLKDGWLWTGDIASMDADGFFKIVDRKKDMILVSGFNVYPNEVEDVIAKHPKVREVAVIGVPDEKSGERVKAYIVPSDASLAETEIRDYCKSQLAAYKCPKAIEFRKDLPKSIVGKILRRELRDEAQPPR